MRSRIPILVSLSLLLSICLLAGFSEDDITGKEAIISTSMNTTIIVAQDGTGDHTNIQDAIDAANIGDIIRVYDGTFYSSVNVHKRVVLIGNGTTTVLDGNNTIDHQDLFRVSADGVNITGFQIREGSPHHELAGIGLYAAYCNISGNLFKNTNNNAMYIAGGPENIIANNTFINNGYCIRSDNGANGNLIKDNIFNGSMVGAIIYQRASGVRILDNQFNDNEYHFADFTTQGFEIGGNDFHRSNVQRYGLMVAGSIDNIYHNNSFEDNGPAMGFINGVNRININDNVFMENIHGRYGRNFRAAAKGQGEGRL